MIDIDEIIRNIAGHLRMADEQLQAARAQLQLAETKLLAMIIPERK